MSLQLQSTRLESNSNRDLFHKVHAMVMRKIRDSDNDVADVYDYADEENHVE